MPHRSQRHLREIYGIDSAGQGSGAPVPTPWQWDASDDSTITRDGNDVDIWNGCSASGTERPQYDDVDTLNGLPVIKFDGVNDYLERSTVGELFNTQQVSVFGVFRGHVNAEVLPGVFTLHRDPYPSWSGPWGLNALAFNNTSSKVETVRPHGAGPDPGLYPPGTYGDIAMSSTTLYTGGYFIYELHLDGSNASLRINGVEEINDGYASAYPIRPEIIRIGSSGLFGSDALPSAGAGGFAEVDIAEILLYTDALSAADNNIMFTYLKEKWLPLSGYAWVP